MPITAFASVSAAEAAIDPSAAFSLSFIQGPDATLSAGGNTDEQCKARAQRRIRQRIEPREAAVAYSLKETNVTKIADSAQREYSRDQPSSNAYNDTVAG